MKHPTLDYDNLYRILAEIPEETPEDLPYFYILYAYIVVLLRKNGGRREETAIKAKMSRRALNDHINRMKEYGFEPPPSDSQNKKQVV